MPLDNFAAASSPRHALRGRDAINALGSSPHQIIRTNLRQLPKPVAKIAPSKRLARSERSIRVVKGLSFDPRIFLHTPGPGRTIRKFSAGESIFRQGDSANAVFYIQKGKVQVTVVSTHGKEGVISLLESGEFFGEGCLANQSSHTATARATTDSTIVAIEKNTMVRALRDEPKLSQMFMSYLLSRNIQVEAELVDHLFNSSEKRLARVLLLLANISNTESTATIPRINQEMLASRIGTTRSRINYFMNKFRHLGFINYDNGALEIHSSLISVVVQG